MEVRKLACLILVGCFSTTTFGQFQNQSAFSPSTGSHQAPSTQTQAPGFRTGNSNYQPPTGTPRTADQSPFATSATAKINWVDGKQLAQAMQQARQTNKPLLLHFWNEKCAPCMTLEGTVFRNPMVANAINSQFIPVKVNTIETPEIHRTYGVTSWPTDVFLAPDGKKLLVNGSPPNADSYIQKVNSVANMSRNFSKFAGGVTSSSRGNQLAATSSSQQDSPFGTNRFATNTSFTPNQKLGQNATARAPTQTQNPTSQNHVAQNQFATQSQSSNTTDFSVSNSPVLAIQNKFYGQQNSGSNSPQNTAASNALSNSSVQNRATGTPAGLEGKCPVTLMKDKKWVSGSKEWGCTHRGRLYFFTSRQYRDEFMKTPDQFAPVLAGYDVVEFRETGRLVEGKNSIGIFAGGEAAKQVYRFTTVANMEKFKQNVGRYNEAVRTAMESANSKLYR